jgi:hypothetical protein
MQAAGMDVSALLATPMGQQLISNPTFNMQAIFGSNYKIPTGIGVYVGAGKGEMITPSAPPQFAGGQPVPGTYKDTVSLSEWKEMFPISNPQGLAQWKKTLVDAGVVSADAGLAELQKQWEAWGEFSQASTRLGQNLSPYDLLDIQRGLWGGGAGAGAPAYSTQLMKKANSREILKQYMQADTGRIISDEEADEFADLIRQKQLAKPTKTETKMVKGKRVTVTTPGFGEAEAAKLAQKRAMQDPLYAEFQTANVFGSALEKALGVRG